MSANWWLAAISAAMIPAFNDIGKRRWISDNPS
jgi:hypothetical protein